MSTEVTEQKPEEGSTSLFSSMVSFFVPTAHADEGDDDKEEKDDEEEKEDGGDDDEEEEEEEPEDIAPAIREECEQGPCAAAAKHFKGCQDKVEEGKGWEHEDCVEEMFHMMHCVDACAGPKLFKALA